MTPVKYGETKYGSTQYGGGAAGKLLSPYIREPVPDRLAIAITPPGASQPLRWAEDEHLAPNVISAVTFDTEMPGGYRQLRGTLGRNPEFYWSDLQTYGDISVYLPGVEEIWNGRLDKSPDESGEHIAINPEAVGYQKELEDNDALQIGIINCDLNAWGDASAARRVKLLGNQRLNVEKILGWQGDGSNPPGVYFDFRGLLTELGQRDGNEAWFDGEGIDLGKLLYKLVELAGATGANWEVNSYFGDEDVLNEGHYYESPNLKEHPEIQVEQSSAGAARKYAMLRARYGPAPSSGVAYTNLLAFYYPKVMGTHGMQWLGAWPNIGFKCIQILEYLIPNFTSTLKIDTSKLDDDGYIIVQAWYPTPGPLANVVRDIVKYSLYDWFVYQNRIFQFRIPGSYSRYWSLRVDETNKDDDGPDGSRLWRDVVVQYQEPSGKMRTVGPTGSGCDVESPSLSITDPEHPAVKANITRRALLNLKGIGTPSLAEALGIRFLEEANLLPRSGSCRAKGYVLDDKAVLHPVSQIRSGDYVKFVNGHDTSYRKVVNTSYNSDQKENTLQFDAPPGGLEQLLERLQASLIPIGVS